MRKNRESPQETVMGRQGNKERKIVPGAKDARALSEARPSVVKGGSDPPLEWVDNLKHLVMIRHGHRSKCRDSMAGGRGASCLIEVKDNGTRVRR